MGLKEACGLFGIFNNKNAKELTSLGLFALQHRGQEAAGIAVSDFQELNYYKELGLVNNALSAEKIKHLKGANAMGHVRYSTTGGNFLENAQPIVVDSDYGKIAIAHNGNIPELYLKPIKRYLEHKEINFQSTTDSEVILHYILDSKKPSLEERIEDGLRNISGAYSLLFLTKDKLIAARDTYGIRPLALGKTGDSYVISSETCAFGKIHAEYVRDIEPGEIVSISKEGINSRSLSDKKDERFCIFELIYFSKPDSKYTNKNIYEFRKEFGRQLAREHPVEADFVIPIPDSGIVAALGYSQESKIPLEYGLVRSHYTGRTFIEENQEIRDYGVRLKLDPVEDVLKNKKIVLVDDSIVRGTTSRKIVRMVRHAGAKEVHLRISSSPIIGSCFYGIDTPTTDELIAHDKNIKEIEEFTEADSLGYLSIEGMLAVASRLSSKNKFCTSCFDGKYIIPVKP